MQALGTVVTAGWSSADSFGLHRRPRLPQICHSHRIEMKNKTLLGKWEKEVPGEHIREAYCTLGNGSSILFYCFCLALHFFFFCNWYIQCRYISCLCKPTVVKKLAQTSQESMLCMLEIVSIDIVNILITINFQQFRLVATSGIVMYCLMVNAAFVAYYSKIKG